MVTPRPRWLPTEMITLQPVAFTKVDYDAESLVTWAQEALDALSGLPSDLDVAVELDESAATTTFALTSIDPVEVRLDSGSVENHRDPRRLGELETKITFTRIFLELLDRRSASFGAPEIGAEVSQAHKVAWEVNLYGRVAEQGLRLHKPRFLYDFRNRHGFTDHADEIFEEIWSGGELGWARIAELSDAAIAGPVSA